MKMRTKKKDEHVWAMFSVFAIIVAAGMWYMIASQPIQPVPPEPMVNAELLQPAQPEAPAAKPAVTKAAKPAQKPSTDVVAIAKSLGATRFVNLLNETGVANSLQGAGPFTIFVPSDAAMAAANKSISAMSRAQLTRMVEYHIIADRQINPAALVSGNVRSLSGDYVNVLMSPIDHTPRIGSGEILKTATASNGIVYVVSSVLLPPQ